MKVLGISGSMRKNGNTSKLVERILSRCVGDGVECEFITLAGKVIRPCLGCEWCKQNKVCIIDDDDWPGLIERVLSCEVLVIGSPTYYYDLSGQLKNFIDRTYSLFHDRRLAGRHGVAVAVHANKGAGRTIETIEGFLNAHEFSSLGFVQGQGYGPDDVLNDFQALEKADAIGDKIVRLIKKSH